MVVLKYLFILSVVLVFAGLVSASAGTVYVNSFNLTNVSLVPDLGSVSLVKLGQGVVVKESFDGGLVLDKKSYCDGNGAYFELPITYNRSVATVVVEADIYNYNAFSGCNEVSVILANDNNQGYAVGYGSFDLTQMWISYRPGGSSLATDVHMGAINIDNLGDRWVHTVLYIYPSGYIKGVLYDYSTGKSWTVVVYDDRVTTFSRIVLLDGNDYRVRNIKVYYDYNDFAPYPIVKPVFYLRVPDDTDFGKIYDSRDGWNDYVSVATLGDGKPAIYKHTKYDPAGGSYVLPVTLDRSQYNIVIEADVMKPNLYNYNGLRFGLEDSNWDGYTTSIDLGGGKIGFDVRQDGMPVNVVGNRVGFSYPAGKWVHVMMILYSDGRIYVSIDINGRVYSGTWTNSQYMKFDRIVIRGGYPIYFRNITVYELKDDPLKVMLEQDVDSKYWVILNQNELFKVGLVEVK